MNELIKEYKNELRVLMLALLFAAIGDLFYGGVEGTKLFLVGVVLSSVSSLLTVVFTIMVLFKLIVKFFVSKKFYNFVNTVSYAEPKPKIKSNRKIKK